LSDRAPGYGATVALPSYPIEDRSPLFLEDRSLLVTELHRVGASLRKAGTASYVCVHLGLHGVKLLGPPREHPRRTWLGPEAEALALLRVLPDDAGTEAVCRALGGDGF
jgi:hypothetical protein